MEETVIELVRVLAAFAPRESDLARHAHDTADSALGKCEWCARGWPLSSSGPDRHFRTADGGGIRYCERASHLSRHMWIQR